MLDCVWRMATNPNNNVWRLSEILSKNLCPRKTKHYVSHTRGFLLFQNLLSLVWWSVANMQGDNFQNAWSLKTWGDSFFALLKRNDEKLSKVIQVLQRKIAICQLYEFGNPNLWKLLILRKISVVRANVTHYLKESNFCPKIRFWQHPLINASDTV